ncbi:hypothetical protein [Streptomyces hydrogenans]|uniref:hypothetical protein n=1 Tax=Streptomyces hydrogenans TaxID=1873719 RepID=UPI003437406D
MTVFEPSEARAAAGRATALAEIARRRAMFAPAWDRRALHIMAELLDIVALSFYEDEPTETDGIPDDARSARADAEETATETPGIGFPQWFGDFDVPIAAIRELIVQHGGEHENQTPLSAEQALRMELAVHGVTPHHDEDTFIGGHRNSWLVVGLADGEFPDMAEQPYVLVTLDDPADGDEVTVERPVKATDQWTTVIGTGDPSARSETVRGQSFRGWETAAVAAYIAQWRRNPYAVYSAALARLAQR